MDTSIDIEYQRVTLGKRIRSLRKAQGLSQYKFSEMIGMDRSFLIGVEKGRRNISIDSLAKIATGLGTTVPSLFQTTDTDELPAEEHENGEERVI